MKGLLEKVDIVWLRGLLTYNLDSYAHKFNDEKYSMLWLEIFVFGNSFE
jgi:hypothetical protein